MKDQSRVPLKVWLMSDLHNDSNLFRFPSPRPDADVLVIAGDIQDDWKKGFEWLADEVVPLNLPIIFTPGNHDFYGYCLEDSAQMREAGREMGIFVLAAGETIQIRDVRFIGATLWTDYEIFGNVTDSMRHAEDSIADMRNIKVGSRHITPQDLLETHQRHRSAIVSQLQIPHDGPSVVITHHAPAEHSLRDYYADDIADASFASDLNDIMVRYKPDYWFHGHVHDYRYYEQEETQIICNPRGYVSEVGELENGEPWLHYENDRFIPDLVIDV